MLYYISSSIQERGAFMGRTIAVVNQKGGVGKTTSAVNLAACVGAHGYRVLLCDIDPQGNATSGLGVNKREVESSTYDMLIGSVDAAEIVCRTAFENLDLLPANIDLAGAELGGGGRLSVGGIPESSASLDVVPFAPAAPSSPDLALPASLPARVTLIAAPA